MFQMLMDLTELMELRQNERNGSQQTADNLNMDNPNIDNLLLGEMLDRKDKEGRTVLHHCLASNSLSGRYTSRKPYGSYGHTT